MGLFDSIVSLAQGQIGSAVLGQIAQHLPGVLQDHGVDGTKGLTEQLTQGGLGDAVSSWIGSGENLPVSAEQITQALGSPMVASLAEKFGIDPAQASQFLAEHLPQLIASQHGSQAG